MFGEIVKSLYLKLMKPITLLCFLLIPFCSFCQLENVETINAYTIKLGKCRLFAKLDSFVIANGLPSEVKAGKTIFPVKTKEDMHKAIKAGMPISSLITLVYPGLETWYSENGLLPFTIDVRKLKSKLIYNNAVIFDTSFQLSQYSKMFPRSIKNQMPAGMSMFKTLTKETGNGYESYIINRQSIDGPDAHPSIEFTFFNKKLVYIVFWNIG